MAVRMTITVQLVVRALLDADDPMYGMQLVDASGVEVGSIYPILARLQAEGWLEDWWETIDPAVEQRPKRHYYKVVSGREAEIRTALDSTGFSKLSVVKRSV